MSLLPLADSSQPDITPPAPGSVASRQFATLLKSPLFVAELLLKRNISTPEEARDFFLAKHGRDFNPSAFLGYDRVIMLLQQIKQRGEIILVHGDYDVDGITATAIMVRTLKQCGFNVRRYLPNRFTDGYGLTVENIHKFKELGVQWIFTVDTGISAVKEVTLAGFLGIKVIITDHHQPSGALPEAEVILNPNQPGCNYPNKALCGAGIAYRVADGLKRSELGASGDEFLPLVAIASLADVVPMTAENRFLVRKGLRLLQVSPGAGLGELLKKTDLVDRDIGTGDVLYRIGPALNAPGRMESPDLSLDLLLTEDKKEAADIVQKILKINASRRLSDKTAFEQAVEIAEQFDAQNAAGVVVSSSQWHEGIIGIVAAKLAERYFKPAFVLSVRNGQARGSGRTGFSINLHELLVGCQDLLSQWGGHNAACGFSISAENIGAFRERINRAITQRLAGKRPFREIKTDAVIRFCEVNSNTMLWLRRFEPFGPGNESPLFYMDDVCLDTGARKVGENHLKFSVTDGYHSCDAIAFGLGYVKNRLRCGDRLKIVFTPEWNYFNNNKTLQLRAVALEGREKLSG